MDSIKHIVLVLSGKGGVGKSSVSSQLAVSLSEKGFKVGLLDIDLTGPSIPHIFNLEDEKVRQSVAGWVPVCSPKNPNLKIMSIGFLQPDRSKSIVWRGPKKSSMIKQFINDVVWGEMDYLIIDTPPGTGDEHIAIATELQHFTNVEGSVLVTTPQEVAAADVRKELNFSNKVNIKVLGVIENMSGYICPHCSDCTNIFSKGGGESLATKFNVPFLGAMPLDPSFIQIVEQGDILSKYSETKVSAVCNEIVDNLVKTIEN